jgi:hypothetical protein
MCLILFTQINNKNIIFKNRDRPTVSHFKIIHEIINGTEIAHTNDLNSGWHEGINEYGIGIINSTFKLNKNNLPYRKKDNYDYKKGQKILKALSYKNIDDVVQSLFFTNNNLKWNGNDFSYDGTSEYKTELQKLKKNFIKDKLYFIEGHTIISSKNTCYHVECDKRNKFTITKINSTKVFTNHGINFPEFGCNKGAIGLSSYLRKFIIEEELKNNTLLNSEELFNITNKNYKNINNKFHPYRDKNYYNHHLCNANLNTALSNTTVSQMLLNLDNLELIITIDKYSGKLKKLINLLPQGYIPKIKIKISQATKSKHEELFLNEHCLNYLYEKFNYRDLKCNKLYTNNYFLFFSSILLLLFIYNICKSLIKIKINKIYIYRW